MRATAVFVFAFVVVLSLATVACQPVEPAADVPAAAAPARTERIAAAQASAPRAEIGVITAVVPLKAREPSTGAGVVIGVVGGAAIALV